MTLAWIEPLSFNKQVNLMKNVELPQIIFKLWSYTAASCCTFSLVSISYSLTCHTIFYKMLLNLKGSKFHHYMFRPIWSSSGVKVWGGENCCFLLLLILLNMWVVSMRMCVWVGGLCSLLLCVVLRELVLFLFYCNFMLLNSRREDRRFSNEWWDPLPESNLLLFSSPIQF
jgi:hypothetical protein